jgi:hypothetical protein
VTSIKSFFVQPQLLSKNKTPPSWNTYGAGIRYFLVIKSSPHLCAVIDWSPAAIVLSGQFQVILFPLLFLVHSNASSLQIWTLACVSQFDSRPAYKAYKIRGIKPAVACRWNCAALLSPVHFQSALQLLSQLILTQVQSLVPLRVLNLTFLFCFLCSILHWDTR